MPEVTIRKMAAADIPDVAEILVKRFPSPTPPMGTDFPLRGEELAGLELLVHENELKQALLHKEHAFVAEREGHIVGFVSAYPTQLAGIKGTVFFGHSAAAAENGRGIGRQLIDQVRRLAGAHGFSHVYFSVHEHNLKLQRYYRELGAEKLGWQNRMEGTLRYRMGALRTGEK